MDKVTATSTTPTRIAVDLPIGRGHVLPGREREMFPEEHEVVRVEWRAVRHAIDEPIVSVTLFTARHDNQSWHRPTATLFHGMRDTPPPSWVPAPPDWFEAVVEQMRP